VLIESWIAWNYGGDESTNLPAPGALSDKLASQAGCDDPLVLTVAAANSTEVHEKIRRFERALAGFQKSSPHKGYPKFFATVSLANEMGNHSPRIRGLDTAALQHFKFEPIIVARDFESIVLMSASAWLNGNPP